MTRVCQLLFFTFHISKFSFQQHYHRLRSEQGGPCRVVVDDRSWIQRRWIRRHSQEREEGRLGKGGRGAEVEETGELFASAGGSWQIGLQAQDNRCNEQERHD